MRPVAAVAVGVQSEPPAHFIWLRFSAAVAVCSVYVHLFGYFCFDIYFETGCNGGVTESSTGLVSANSNGGSVIYNDTAKPATGVYEAKATLHIPIPKIP